MKSLIKFIILIIISTSFNSCESDDAVDNPSIDTHSVEKFSSSISDFNMALAEYVEITQKCEGANFSKMSMDEVSSLMADYIKATEAYIEAYRYSMEFNPSAAKSTQNKFDSNCLNAAGSSTLSPTLPVKMAGIMKEVKVREKKTREDVQNGVKDENEGKNEMASTLIWALTSLFETGTAMIMATGAVLITGHAFRSMSRPPGWIVGGTIKLTAAGLAGGSVIYYATTSKEDSKEQKKGGEQDIILSGRTTVGGSIPLHLFPDNSDVVIAIDGYAPVALNNFKLPQSGMNKIIEVEGVKLKDSKWGGTSVVCISEEKMTALSCVDVQFVNASAYPPNPAPGQGVTVTASLIPVATNCNISFTITGTDGYANSSTKPSNSNGQASFEIPGGAKEVVDVVTITSSNGKKYTVTYVF